jgi:DNA transposition AAA+ family ATPase
VFRYLKVRNSQQAFEFDKAPPAPDWELTDNEKALLQELETRSTMGLDELKERIDEAKRLIAKGFAKLEVVQQPWGVEFSLKLVKL